jgi:hypothetical protein
MNRVSHRALPLVRQTLSGEADGVVIFVSNNKLIVAHLGKKPLTFFYIENSCSLLPSQPVTVAARSGHELSSLARTLGSWVRIPLVAWMSLCVYSVFALGSGLATG